MKVTALPSALQRQETVPVAQPFLEHDALWHESGKVFSWEAWTNWSQGGGCVWRGGLGGGRNHASVSWTDL